MKWKFLERWIGNTALSRSEKLIADKLDEIARISGSQDADLRAIQKRINRVDVRINGLKKDRELILDEMESAKRINETRNAQLNAELAELQAQARQLSQPEVLTIPAGESVTIRTGGE